MTLAASDCFNRKKIHSIVMQAICDVNKFFGMFVLANLAESMMVGNSRCLVFIDNSRIVRFYKSQWWLLEV